MSHMSFSLISEKKENSEWINVQESDLKKTFLSVFRKPDKYILFCYITVEVTNSLSYTLIK